MGRRKKRPFTPAERAEVEKLSAQGIRGDRSGADRAADLFKINSAEYGEINRRVRKEVQDAVRRDGIG